MKRDFEQGEKEKYTLLGGGGSAGENTCIFEHPRLDFLQFQHDFPFIFRQEGRLAVKNPSWGEGAKRPCLIQIHE